MDETERVIWAAHDWSRLPGSVWRAGRHSQGRPRPLAEILQTARLSTNMDARTAEKDLAVASMTDSQATTTCLGE